MMVKMATAINKRSDAKTGNLMVPSLLGSLGWSIFGFSAFLGQLDTFGHWRGGISSYKFIKATSVASLQDAVISFLENNLDLKLLIITYVSGKVLVATF